MQPPLLTVLCIAAASESCMFSQACSRHTQAWARRQGACACRFDAQATCMDPACVDPALPGLAPLATHGFPATRPERGALQDRVRTPPPSINNPVFPAPVVHNPVGAAPLLPALDPRPAPSVAPSVLQSAAPSLYHSTAGTNHQSAAGSSLTGASAPAAKKVGPPAGSHASGGPVVPWCSLGMGSGLPCTQALAADQVAHAAMQQTPVLGRAGE